MKYNYAIILFTLIHFNALAQGVGSNISGVSVGLFGKYNTWNSNSNAFFTLADENPNGISYGIQLGYGFTSNWKALIAYEHSNYDLNNLGVTNTVNLLEVGVRYNFLASINKIRPYLQAAVGQNTLNLFPVFFTDSDGNVYENAKEKDKGISFSTNLGVNYFVTPDLSFDLAAGGRFGNFTKSFVNGSEFILSGENLDFRYFYVSLGLCYSFY